jgi:hypothetical protein
MKKFYGTSFPVFMLSVLSIGLLTPPLSVAGNRGRAPECQEECLTKHTEKMHEAVRKYKETGNRLDYQTNIKRLLNEYGSCLDNCHDPYPVK